MNEKTSMKVKKFLLLPVLLFSTLAALSGCGKSVSVETDTAAAQTTAEPVEETSVPDLTTAAPESETESRSETQTSARESAAPESESDPILNSEQETSVTPSVTQAVSPEKIHSIDEELKDRVADMSCSGSINRFRENVKISQSGMSPEEIARLLVDQNIVCFYTFAMDILIYYDYNAKGYTGVTHYLFSSYSELSDFVYSTYIDQYAAELLSNLYGWRGELYRGDDSCLLWDPSVQGINVLLTGDLFSEYTCEIIEMSESRMEFAVTFGENSEFSRIEVCAVLQDGEWRLEEMFPNIQHENPNIT